MSRRNSLKENSCSFQYSVLLLKLPLTCQYAKNVPCSFQCPGHCNGAWLVYFEKKKKVLSTDTIQHNNFWGYLEHIKSSERAEVMSSVSKWPLNLAGFLLQISILAALRASKKDFCIFITNSLYQSEHTLHPTISK